MKSKKTTKHRGEVLQTVVYNSGMSITALSRKAGYSRTSFYNHVQDPELSFNILKDYGKALKHDFSIEFPEMSKSALEEEHEEYHNPTTLEEAIAIADKWKHKYYALLEKYHHLLEEKLRK